MAKKKYYVVWRGRTPGIYDSWPKCQAEVNGFKGALYKSFPSYVEAKEAYTTGPDFMEKTKQTDVKDYIKQSISVDAACSGNPGIMEYRGVYTANGEELFHHGPVSYGTNNIGEFLAIVHALALMKKKKQSFPIYSDSQTAIHWVKQKKVSTTITRNKRTEEVFQLIDRALSWLKQHTYENKILKWNTEEWGEIKADFGRK